MNKIRIFQLVRTTLFAFSYCALSVPASPQPATRTVANVVAAAKPAVVFIVVATATGAQSGSGFVLKSDERSSTIVTANHVIEGGSQIDVIFDSDEHERYSANVVSSNHIKDVAILRVNAGNRPVLHLASVTQVQEGIGIILIGYPLATLEFRRVQGDDLRPSVHSGIVSAIRFHGAVIQFDATTFHGDSGGPIIDSTTGNVVAIVHGAELDSHYSSVGLEQSLPGSSFGPSAQTIREVADTSVSATESNAPAASTTSESTARSNSASYRVGYGVPHEIVESGETDSGQEINSAVESSALSRLTEFLKADNSLYLIPVSLQGTSLQEPQQLSGYCDDNRLNALVAPMYSWRLTGGPRTNSYGRTVGYEGEASVTVSFFVFDCYGIPFFAGHETKSENRYFAHRNPGREIVDMANDLLDHLMSDFALAKTAHTGAWNSLLKTGIPIDPSDTSLHSLMFFKKIPEGFQVVTVVPNGPAGQAGVQKQDIIVRIDDRDASNMTIDEMKAAIKSSTYTLSVQRPGGLTTITVHPAEYADIVRALQH